MLPLHDRFAHLGRKAEMTSKRKILIAQPEVNEKIGVDGRIILKLALKKVSCGVVGCIQLA